MTKIRSFLKWAGGKYNCLDQIISTLPPAARLIEPFAGSGVIFMNANYPIYLLGESNEDLINLFTTLQTEGESFIQYCETYFQPEFNCSEKYYDLRSEFNASNDLRKKSALFLYLNRHGFNGLCRYNSKGIYNVPFGRYTKLYFPLKEMTHFYQKSSQVEFISADYKKTFECARLGDVIYCDPPYVPLKAKTPSIAYTQKSFSQTDQIELATLAKATASRGIPVIISNHDTELTRQHYESAKIHSFNVSRVINSNITLRQPVKELVAVFDGGC